MPTSTSTCSTRTGSRSKTAPELVGSYGNNVGEEGSQRPAEFFSWENEEPETRSAAGDRPLLRRKIATPCLRPGRRAAGEADHDRTAAPATEYPASTGADVVGPTVFGHSGAAGAISVGAVPFFDSSSAETFSSRGPVKHYFGPVTGTSSPAAPIARADDSEAGHRRDRRRRDDLLRHPPRRGQPLLRHLRRGAARGRSRRPRAAGEPGADARRPADRAARDREPGRRLRPRRGRRRPRRRP